MILTEFDQHCRPKTTSVVREPAEAETQERGLSAGSKVTAWSSGIE